LDHRLGTELAAHALAWLRQRPTHALDVEIVLLRPERWRHAVGHIAAGSIASGDRAMLLCMPPILKPYRPVRAGKARAVAGCEDCRIAGTPVVVDHDAVLHMQSSCFRKCIFGHRAG